MSTRDELANLIDDAAEWATSQGRICSPHEVADAILAAGYSRPRVVETIEELEVLPEGAVVLTEQGGIYEAELSGIPPTSARTWWATGWQYPASPSDLALPATVLYLPEETP